MTGQQLLFRKEEENWQIMSKSYSWFFLSKEMKAINSMIGWITRFVYCSPKEWKEKGKGWHYRYDNLTCCVSVWYH